FYNKNLNGDPSSYWRLLSNIRPSSLTPVFFDCTWTDALVQYEEEQAVLAKNTIVDPPTCTTTSNGGPLNDEIPDNFNGANNGQGGVVTGLASNMTNRIALNRHRFAINMVFADGSAQTVPLTQLWDFVWFRGGVPLRSRIKYPASLLP
ncbi:MAG TPA: hypothetical protein VL992_07680, partial [Tepidisphaeraceae bacterium]|nr:hypothetical protein [Tepidisphaeraceae bacterium]